MHTMIIVLVISRKHMSAMSWEEKNRRHPGNVFPVSRCLLQECVLTCRLEVDVVILV